MTIAEVRDGTSNTFCLGDKNLSMDVLGSYPYDDNEGYAAGWDDDNICQTQVLPAPDIHESTNPNIFGSSHPSGLNMSMVNGSVHFDIVQHRSAHLAVPGQSQRRAKRDRAAVKPAVGGGNERRKNEK